MFIRKIVIVAVYVLTFVLAMTAASGYYTPDKRPHSELERSDAPANFVSGNQRTFMMQNRYGRAGGGKNVIVAPRTDKFFLSSRYGKRSSDAPLRTESLVYPVTLCGTDEDLTCVYTGVANLYRCVQSSLKKDTLSGPELLSSSK